VRDGYLDIARQEPRRFRLVDAEQNEAMVAKAIATILTDFLDGR
jgi:thymidylate kinase